MGVGSFDRNSLERCLDVPGREQHGSGLAHVLATRLIRVLFGYRYTDLGPFRAITRVALEQLQMGDPDYGWTVEMQVKALRHGLRVTEVPVSYRKRVGQSKIAGTLRGTLGAGSKILLTIGRHALRGRSKSG